MYTAVDSCLPFPSILCLHSHRGRPSGVRFTKLNLAHTHKTRLWGYGEKTQTTNVIVVGK